MKHKRDSSLGNTSPSAEALVGADELRSIFARVNPHVPIQAYDNFLSQYAPTSIAATEVKTMVRCSR